MSDSDDISIKQYHDKSLNQANKSFDFAVKFAVTGLIFFILGFCTILVTYNREDFTDVISSLNTITNTFDQKKFKNILNNDNQLDQEDTIEGEGNITEKPEISKEIDDLRDLRDDISFVSSQIKKKLLTVSRELVVVSLVGGGLIEAIAAINFLQYRKVVSQVTKDLDTYQRFFIANNICNDLKDPLKDETRCELVKVIAGIPIPSVDKGTNNPKGDSRDSSNGQTPPQSSTTDKSNEEG